jgi:hypothetical protein
MTFGLGNLNSIPIIANDIVYEGSLVGDNGAGYGRPLVAGDRFVGHAKCKCDNTDGSAGDKNIQLIGGTRYRLIVDLVALITDVGQPVYASDDATLSMMPAITTTANSYVGVVTRYVSATQMEVEFRPGECDEFGPNTAREVWSANQITAAADNGKIIYVDTDAVVVTLLAVAGGAYAGYTITLVNIAGAGVALVSGDFNAADLMAGGCGKAADADGHQIRNTKATARRGDFVKLVSNGGTGFNLVAMRGTWAME